MKKVFPNATYRDSQNQVILDFKDSETNHVLGELSKYDVHFISEEKHTLEDYFMQFY
ncbi:hypothetical protein AALA56_06040 [Streptococcus hyointestinalis]|uniref:hypothetical protein n=1 Tax=Streptococcus hyointestinalis TaxID=1337 RepID=UPI0035144259